MREFLKGFLAVPKAVFDGVWFAYRAFTGVVFVLVVVRDVKGPFMQSAETCPFCARKTDFFDKHIEKCLCGATIEQHVGFFTLVTGGVFGGSVYVFYEKETTAKANILSWKVLGTSRKVSVAECTS